MRKSNSINSLNKIKFKQFDKNNKKLNFTSFSVYTRYFIKILLAKSKHIFINLTYFIHENVASKPQLLEH